MLQNGKFTLKTSRFNVKVAKNKRTISHYKALGFVCLFVSVVYFYRKNMIILT